MITSTSSRRNGSSKNGSPDRRQNQLREATPKSSSKTSSAKSQQSEAEQIEILSRQLTGAIAKHFRVTLRDRDQRQSTKVGYACREVLGNDISAVLKKSGKTLDWSRFNKFFATLFGDVESMKYSPRVVAAVVAQFFDRFSLDPDEAVAQLVEYNRESLERRNRQQRQEDDDFDLDEDEEDEIVDDFEGEFEEEQEDEFDSDLDEDEFSDNE